MNTTAGEEKHKPYKQQAPFTNGHIVDLQLLRRTNVLQTLRSISDGAFESCFWITSVLESVKLNAPALFHQLSPANSTILEEREEHAAIVTHDEDTINIRVFNRVTRARLPQGYTTDATQIASGLLSIYQRLGIPIPVVHGRLIYFNNLTFRRRKIAKQVSVKVGGFVAVRTHKLPVLIRAVFLHKRRLTADRCFIVFEELLQDSVAQDLLDAPILRLNGQIICEEMSAIVSVRPHLLKQSNGKWIWNKFNTTLH